MISDSGLDVAWFLRLRWVVITCQLVLFLAGDRWREPLPELAPFVLIVGVQLAINAAAVRWVRRRERVPEITLPALMALDAALLTAMLFAAGPDGRSLAVLYLVNIALAGILLRSWAMWLLVSLSVVGIALVVGGEPTEVEEHADPIAWQLYEMWMALAVTAALIGYVVQRTGRMLQRRAEVLQARQRLAALGTLAAGAAHELATPLSVIAVASKELLRVLERQPQAGAAVADARLIREQVERCREILAGLAADAGSATGEALGTVELGEVVALSVRDLNAGDRVSCPPHEGPFIQVRAPPRAVAQAIRALLKNALQASPPGTRVHVSLERRGGFAILRVRDEGPGMDSGELARVGEPFFTTKAPGEGMGLGVFFARTLVEQLGGQLELTSAPGAGTAAEVRLPLSGAGRAA